MAGVHRQKCSTQHIQRVYRLKPLQDVAEHPRHHHQIIIHHIMYQHRLHTPLHPIHMLHNQITSAPNIKQLRRVLTNFGLFLRFSHFLMFVFSYCLNGELVPSWCPADTVFSELWQGCVPPNEVGCLFPIFN